MVSHEVREVREGKSAMANGIEGIGKDVLDTAFAIHSRFGCGMLEKAYRVVMAGLCRQLRHAPPKRRHRPPRKHPLSIPLSPSFPLHGNFAHFADFARDNSPLQAPPPMNTPLTGLLALSLAVAAGAAGLAKLRADLAADPELAPLAEDILRNNAMRLFGAEETR